jgi:hypothetical protein
LRPLDFVFQSLKSPKLKQELYRKHVKGKMSLARLDDATVLAIPGAKADLEQAMLSNIERSNVRTYLDLLNSNKIFTKNEAESIKVGLRKKSPEPSRSVSCC